MEYVDNQQANKTESGFVMEEDMLSSSDKLPLKMQNASADPTSRMVPTNEVKIVRNQTSQKRNNNDFIRYSKEWISWRT
jgi:hypothetical protein